MLHFARFAVDEVLRRSPLQVGMERWSRRRLKVLAYHGVDDPVQFELHLRHVHVHGLPVGQTQVLDHLRGAALPRGPVLITFDDGRRSVIERGLPLLRRYATPALVFVVAGHIDSDKPLWWDELEWLTRAHSPARAASLKAQLKRAPNDIRLAVLKDLRSRVATSLRTPQLTRADLLELQSSGVEIGNHTLTHPILPNCSIEKATEEIVRSHELLTKLLGRSPVSFAYPYGARDPRIEALLADLGYRLVFTFDHRVNPAPLNPCRVSRLRVDSSTSLSRFAVILSGLHPAIHALRNVRARGAVG